MLMEGLHFIPALANNFSTIETITISCSSARAIFLE